MKPPKLLVDFPEKKTFIDLDYPMYKKLKLLTKKLNVSKRELVRRGIEILLAQEGIVEDKKVVWLDQEEKTLKRKRKPVVLK